jgi:hypothetical protein
VDPVFNNYRSSTTTDDNISDNSLKANGPPSLSSYDKESSLAKLKQEGVHADINIWIYY